MKFFRKAIPSYIEELEAVEIIVDLAEANDIEVIRVKSTEKTKRDPLEQCVSTLYGFEVLVRTRSGVKCIKRSMSIFPSIDGHRYAYIPKTERNIKMLAAILSQGPVKADDPQTAAEVLAVAKENDYNIEYKAPTADTGIATLIEKRKLASKENELEDLKKAVAAKKIDDDIAALKAQLSEKPAEVEVIEEPETPAEPEVIEAPVVEEKPEKKEKKLAGKKLSKK